MVLGWGVSAYFHVSSVYFAIRGKCTAGAILSFGEPNWLNWSCDQDSKHGLAYGLCHLLCKILNLNLKP